MKEYRSGTLLENGLKRLWLLHNFSHLISQKNCAIKLDFLKYNLVPSDQARLIKFLEYEVNEESLYEMKNGFTN